MPTFTERNIRGNDKYYVNFKVVDNRGRKIGAIVKKWEVDVKINPAGIGGRCGKGVDKDGEYYVVFIQSTRDGEYYGPGQNSRFFKAPWTRSKYIQNRLKMMRRSAIKKFAITDQKTGIQYKVVDNRIYTDTGDPRRDTLILTINEDEIVEGPGLGLDHKELVGRVPYGLIRQAKANI